MESNTFTTKCPLVKGTFARLYFWTANKIPHLGCFKCEGTQNFGNLPVIISRKPHLETPRSPQILKISPQDSSTTRFLKQPDAPRHVRLLHMGGTMVPELGFLWKPADCLQHEELAMHEESHIITRLAPVTFAQLQNSGFLIQEQNTSEQTH